jgi:hypothetical protein
MSDASVGLKTSDPKPARKYGVVIGVLLVFGMMGTALAVLLILGFKGNASTADLKQATARRDCVTLLSTARRAVFDDVTLYTSLSTQYLNDVLLANAVGSPLSQEQKDTVTKLYRENNTSLAKSLVEARRLQPARVLDDLIERGGSIDGRQYVACPG